MTNTGVRILTGVDGSKESRQAAQWAAARAKQAGGSLEVLCAYALPSYTAASMDSGFAVVDNESIKDSAQAVVDQTVSELKQEGLEVSGRIEAGDPTAILMEESKSVDLIVVGTRGGGGFTDRLLGATSSALPAHSTCPVVVVPSSSQPGSFIPVEKIVIGIDGSNRSRRSLQAAIKETKLWNAQLTAIEAVPMASSAGVLAWLPAAVDRDAILRDVRKELTSVCEEEIGDENISFRAHALDGSAAALLTEFSTAVDLVVVGTRGKGGFAGVLMGSTSQSVLAHSSCPVMVIPTGDRQSAPVQQWDRPHKG